MADENRRDQSSERSGSYSPAATLGIDALQAAFLDRSYVADRALAVALHLSIRLGKPLLLEGEAGVGKTEVAKVLADLQGARLIRLQCYEGLDINTAVYEWNFARQMLEIRLLEAQGHADRESLKDIFGPDFLIRRPLLQAIEHHDPVPPVLLIDELDRADAEFEAFLLELLSDFQITIPELGTVTAVAPPAVILTSNRTREVHDALKRRCLYHWIDYPTVEKERRIIALRVPGASAGLARQVSAFVHRLRALDLYKQPGIAESLDWARALVTLDQAALSDASVQDTLGCVLKYEEDLHRVRGGTARAILAEIMATG
ncbi:MAG TPA: MoxR family ATPase [Chloroflexota bacterium]|nr:MoxR family ATPase [Chloroflexota bacterium]